MAARAMWKGSISFGLVNIPIQAFSVQQRSPQENMKSTSAVAKKKKEGYGSQ